MDKLAADLLAVTSDYNVISFDVFDTLLKRDVPKPVDVFTLVGRDCHVRGFHYRRILAEMLARCRTIGKEVTLEQIYAELHLPEVLRHSLMEKELDWEYRVSTPNLPIRDVYQKLRASGKRIYAVSDMYLPVEVITKLLKKCGYELDGIFVSSEYRVFKRDGALFRIFLENTGLTASEVIHVGDNPTADALGAESAGIRTELIHSHIQNTTYMSIQGKTDTLDTHILQSFINNRINEIDDMPFPH